MAEVRVQLPPVSTANARNNNLADENVSGNGSLMEERCDCITGCAGSTPARIPSLLMNNQNGISTEDWEACLRVLQIVAKDPALAAGEERFKALVAKVHREGKRGVRRGKQQHRQEADCQTKAETGLVRAHRGEKFEENALHWGRLQAPALCYICKQAYTHVHPWYHLLCPDCADLNAAKRQQRADLTGRRALVTGGRIKIGFGLALRLLRDGADVLITTRFPADAARRFAAEPDNAQWQARLRIAGLDLRHLPTVERFADALLAEEPALDILVNNAAQTVRRPPAFYQHLLAAEEAAQALLPASVTASVLPDAEELELAPYFPPGLYDADGQQLDTRPLHSWRLRLGEIDTREMLEAQLVNAAAPFILNSRLKPLLMRSAFERRFIVNVSAMEGQFGRGSKTVFHPHTNMAKAALNMMTRTSARDYAQSGIYMNSVDTGWVTDENPHPQKTREGAGGAGLLDAPGCIEDAVARIYDPIVHVASNDACRTPAPATS